MLRCEVQHLSWDEFVLERSKGTRSSHSLTSVWLCGTIVAVLGRAGVQVWLSETVTCFDRVTRQSGVQSGEERPISAAAFSARAFNLCTGSRRPVIWAG